MGDNKSAVVGKRFEMECYTFGYESEREHGLARLAKSKSLETTASVPAEPAATLDARLEQKAKALARSIKPHREWRDCSFKRFLPEAEQVFSLESPSASQNPKTVFTPDRDGLIRIQATWSRPVRQGTDMDDVDINQTFAIPFLPNENPLDTARRLLTEVMEKGEWRPRHSIESGSDTITSIFNFNLPQAALIRKAVGLKKQVEANIKSEEELRAKEQRRISRENNCYPYSRGNACY